jgi:dTDP-4-amino-4,6-dideoxygalactose transaminase
MNISYGKQSIDKNDIKYVVNTLKKDFLTQGPLVEKFETQLKLKLNSKYATVVNNGSSALLAVGKILNWAPGDFIAVSPITFLSSVNVVEHCGATPIFIDINLKDYSMDPKALELILKKDKKKRIKAAIITDYGGQPAQWSEFRRLKRKYKIALINDNCHALGSIYNNNYGYAVKYADFVTLSFHPVKAITTGEGGAILTNNLLFDRKAKLFRSHGIERNVNQHWKYKMNILGYNLRLPDLNCALGISQIKKLKKFIKKRQEIAIFYNNLFKNNIKFNIPLNIKNNKNSYHLYPLLLNLKMIKKKKDQIIEEFLKKNIKVQVHYIPVNTQPFYKKKYGFNKKNFPNSMKFYENIISLPIYYDITLKKLHYIKTVCKKIFNF